MLYLYHLSISSNKCYTRSYHLFLFYLAYCRQLTAPDGTKSRTIRFGVIEIQGGGIIEIQSDSEGLWIICTSFLIRNGGVLSAGRLRIHANSVLVEQSGLIDLRYRVSNFYELQCLIFSLSFLIFLYFVVPPY